MSASAVACAAVMKLLFGNISKSTSASNFKIYDELSIDSLYISTGNGVITYFRSASNRINVTSFWVILGRDFSMSVQSIAERLVYSFGKGDWRASPLFCDAFEIFASWPRKWGSRGPNVVYALHRWLLQVFSKTTEDSNPQVHTSVKPKGINIYTVGLNDVISYFRLAANCVHAIAAVPDFAVAKWSFWNISESTKASNFKI